jgi:hypothetical protein
VQFGAAGSGAYYFQGQMSNIQIYDTALSAAEIQALYAKGVGGDALAVPNLVGWWPLNGDTKDYSGNGNGAGTPYNMSMNSTWGTGYK